jgi:steroid delta-isomerase-like uncharacterized protein
MPQTVEVAREEVFTRFANALKQRDANGLAALHAPDAELHLPFRPEGVKGRDAVRKFNEPLLKALQDIDIRTLNIAAKGDVVAAEFVLTARHTGALEMPTGTLPPTNRQVTLPAAVFLRINREGLIAEARGYFDMVGFLQQLGVKLGGV